MSNQALALCNLERYEEALVCFEKAIVLDARDPDLWQNKGVTLCRLKRDREAIVCFVKAADVSPPQRQVFFKEVISRLREQTNGGEEESELVKLMMKKMLKPSTYMKPFAKSNLEEYSFKTLNVKLN